MVAKLLHVQSPRREKPFVVMDCAALHENLLQSELFGHEKGAFTGAVRQRHGLFEVAHGGTIFLDEVGDTSLEVQAKLLRVLETGRFRRLGGTQEISVDVRVISATNRELKQAIARGKFREDLFFRLATLTVEIPPLRERRDDIQLLVEHFTRQLNLRFFRSRPSPEGREALERYPWPGNVRELIHVLEHAVFSPTDVIGRKTFPPRCCRRHRNGRTLVGEDVLRDRTPPRPLGGEQGRRNGPRRPVSFKSAHATSPPVPNPSCLA